jgi:hypothetical protein
MRQTNELHFVQDHIKKYNFSNIDQAFNTVVPGTDMQV